MKIKFFIFTAVLLTLSACQVISPVFVNYNGVRMDIAKWINSQTFLSMQQKRSLAQLSKAQQRLVKIDQIIDNDKLEISTQNAIAMHCATQYLSTKKITELQEKVFMHAKKTQILNKFQQDFPMVKLNTSEIKCD